MDALEIRFGTLADLDIIRHHRYAMFADMGTPIDWVDSQDKPFMEWARRMLESGQLVQWFVVDGEQVVAGAAVWLMDWLPGPYNPTGKRVYVFNVYTEVPYRKRGLARRLMETINTWAREQGIENITLHASLFGKPLYESLGYVQTNEMRFELFRKHE